MVCKAQAKTKISQVQRPAHLRPKVPAHHQRQHRHESEDAQRVHFHNHRLAPHEAIEGQQQAGGDARGETNGVALAVVQFMKKLNAFEHQLRASGNHQRQQPASERRRHGRGERHAPSDVAEGQLGECPRVKRPHRIPRRMRHAGVHGAHRQLARILQREVRREGIKINAERNQRGQRECNPIASAEEGRRLRGRFSFRRGFGRGLIDWRFRRGVRGLQRLGKPFLAAFAFAHGNLTRFTSKKGFTG